MNYPISVNSFADELIHNYAKFEDNHYVLDLFDISDFDQHEFAALIMSSDVYLSSEATGPDNPSFDKKMLPSLLKFLSKSTDKDAEIDFVNSWKQGITNYFKDRMQEILKDRLYDYNVWHGHINKEEFGCKRDNGQGVNIWG